MSIHGETSGVVDVTLASLRRDAEICGRAERGTWVTFPYGQRIRAGGKVFVVKTEGNG